MYSIQFPDQLDPAQFLKHYWQRQPLYMPQAWPEFENPLPPEELAGLALEEDIPSRIVEQHADGHWSVQQGPFNEADFAALEGKAWSLLITDIEKHLPDFMAYVQPFRFIPDWRFDDFMISYAPPGGSVGPHIDDYDVFLIQAEGEREWALEGHFRDLPQAQHELIPDIDLRLIKDYKTAETHLCQPGDILYLPPRLGHHGVAKSDCMTWSMGFKAPNFHNMLMDYLDEFADANEHKRYTDPGMPVQAMPGEVTAQQIQQLKSWFVQQLNENDEQFSRWAGRFLSRSALGEELDLDVEAITESRFDVEPNPFIRFEFMRLKGRVLLYVAGEEYEVSEALALALTGKSRVTVSPQSSQDQTLLKLLLKKGYLLTAEDE